MVYIDVGKLSRVAGVINTIVIYDQSLYIYTTHTDMRIFSTHFSENCDQLKYGKFIFDDHDDL